MKKFLILPIICCLLFATGCETASDLITDVQEKKEQRATQLPTEFATPNTDIDTEESGETEEPKTTIFVSDIIKMNNEWTMMGECEGTLTDENKKDRILLGTSAQAKNGKMQWGDSQYWTLAVISERGAYNLLSVQINGQVYFEYGEAFIKGVSTPIVTAYIFSGNAREIRSYVYDKANDFFVEEIIYTTTDFSTGGVNTFYSTFPEYKSK